MRAAELLAPQDPPIDFVSLDVEGTEIDVLEGFDLGRNQPRLLLVEALTQEALGALDDYLRRFGYMRARTVTCNHFYVLSRSDALKLQCITIDCALTVPILPGYGPAGLGTRAWSAPTTSSRIGFVAGKLRQRYRRLLRGI